MPELVRLDLDTVRSHLADGAALVDARPIDAFSRAHAVGAISIQHRSVFASWLGWLVDLTRPVVFILDDTTDRIDLVRQCLTVGHDAILGELDGGLEIWMGAGLPVASIPIVDPAGIDGSVLDVRQDTEWTAGHVPDALHIELGALAGAAIPDGPVTVMCGHGERAMTGASLLESAGQRAVSVLVGGPDEWRAATGTDLTTG